MDKIIIEYRRDPPSPKEVQGQTHFVNWYESKMNWSREDIQFLNKICGYIKYRERKVTA